MRPELAILILNYRTTEMTLDCLESLAADVTPTMTVVVVDNASGDGSADRIEKGIDERGYGAWARVLRSPVNGGFAAGNNFGMRSVDADAYVLLNSDTIVRPGVMPGLLDAMRRHPEAGLLAPGMVDGEGRFDQSFFREPAPPTELLRAAQTGVLTKVLSRFDPILPRSERPIEPDWVGFACVLVPKHVVQKVGMLDEGFFMYFEDIDYCRRVREAGYSILVLPHLEVVHLQGASSRISAQGTRQKRAPRYFYESRARYYAKYYGTHGLWMANGFWYAGRCLSWVREYLGNRSPHDRENEAVDIWINALHPMRESSARASKS
ncbi:MAG: glycosyltransferase family 2 protein [Polyangiales bacterium]